MSKITFIGAGSVVFTRNLCSDILLTPALQDSTISLMDIDPLGPGGVFRGLRTIPVLLKLCEDMDEVAPDALLLNYVNPMAINCWAVADGSGRPHVGLCHSVQGTSEMLARWIGVPYDEVNFLCAGINHQAFFLEFRRGMEDLYPLIWQALEC